jgi:hypothetical protein
MLAIEAAWSYGAGDTVEMQNNDLAAVLDPTGTRGGTAGAGYSAVTEAPGNSDVAAIGGSNSVDIVPSSSFENLSTLLSDLTSLL